MSKRTSKQVSEVQVGTTVQTFDPATITVGSGVPSTIVRPSAPEGMFGVTIQGSPECVFTLPKTRKVKGTNEGKTETANTQKTVQRFDWEGMAVTKVLRWLGSKGITAKPASEALRKLGIEGVAQATVQTQVQLGKKGTKVPTLTDEQASKLLAVCS